MGSGGPRDLFPMVWFELSRSVPVLYGPVERSSGIPVSPFPAEEFFQNEKHSQLRGEIGKPTAESIRVGVRLFGDSGSNDARSFGSIGRWGARDDASLWHVGQRVSNNFPALFGIGLEPLLPTIDSKSTPFGRLSYFGWEIGSDINLRAVSNPLACPMYSNNPGAVIKTSDISIIHELCNDKRSSNWFVPVIKRTLTNLGIGRGLYLTLRHQMMDDIFGRENVIMGPKGGCAFYIRMADKWHAQDVSGHFFSWCLINSFGNRNYFYLLHAYGEDSWEDGAVLPHHMVSDLFLGACLAVRILQKLNLTLEAFPHGEWLEILVEKEEIWRGRNRRRYGTLVGQFRSKLTTTIRIGSCLDSRLLIESAVATGKTEIDCKGRETGFRAVLY